MNKRLIYLLLFLLFAPTLSYSMHIAEGFLPIKWAIIWWIVFLPFLAFGLKKISNTIKQNSSAKLLFAVVGAFVFLLSSLKLPSVAGSSSHLTGIALGAILFGVSSMSVIGFIALLFQALLLAHGGLTTLGANAFSMAVCGAFVAVWVFKLAKTLKCKLWLQVFLATFFSNMVIYSCTSVQLASAFSSEATPFSENLIKFLSVFAITQLPLALLEGVFTIFAFRLVYKTSNSEILNINPSV